MQMMLCCCMLFALGDRCELAQLARELSLSLFMAATRGRRAARQFRSVGSNLRSGVTKGASGGVLPSGMSVVGVPPSPEHQFSRLSDLEPKKRDTPGGRAATAVLVGIACAHFDAGHYERSIKLGRLLVLLRHKLRRERPVV